MKKIDFISFCLWFLIWSDSACFVVINVGIFSLALLYYDLLLAACLSLFDVFFFHCALIQFAACLLRFSSGQAVLLTNSL